MLLFDLQPSKYIYLIHHIYVYFRFFFNIKFKDNTKNHVTHGV
jgi:hypothetical protein